MVIADWGRYTWHMREVSDVVCVTGNMQTKPTLSDLPSAGISLSNHSYLGMATTMMRYCHGEQSFVQGT